MGGGFDVARPRLVQVGPASDEWDHFQRGLVDGFNPHDRLITWLTLVYPFMNLSLSDFYLPT